jgi:hypothetical protein
VSGRCGRIEVRGLTKRFGAATAVNDPSFPASAALAIWQRA